MESTFLSGLSERIVLLFAILFVFPNRPLYIGTLPNIIHEFLVSIFLLENNKLAQNIISLF